MTRKAHYRGSKALRVGCFAYTVELKYYSTAQETKPCLNLLLFDIIAAYSP
jgi:hypothetical protein